MADEETPQRPAETAAPPAPEPTTAPPATRWSETLWTFRSVLAVAVASLLVGGAGGALVVAATDDEGPNHRRPAVYIDGDRMGPRFRNGPFDGPGKGSQWHRNDDRPPNQTGPLSPATPAPTTPTPSQ